MDPLALSIGFGLLWFGLGIVGLLCGGSLVTHRTRTHRDIRTNLFRDLHPGAYGRPIPGTVLDSPTVNRRTGTKPVTGTDVDTLALPNVQLDRYRAAVARFADSDAGRATVRGDHGRPGPDRDAPVREPRSTATAPLT